MCSSFRNKHRSEQPSNVPAAHKTNKGTLGHCQLFKAATRHTVFREASPLVYDNLPFVLVQVAGSPAMHPEVLEMP